MRIVGINIQNFRNFRTTALEFDGLRFFFRGKNAQGKTNLLEALSLVTAVRSFRTRSGADLVRHGGADCALRFRLEHESEGEVELLLKISSKSKQVSLNSVGVGRLSEVVGRYPSVVFSSPDDQILRGSPGVRRRFMDSVISSMDRDHCEALRNYQRAVDSRNRLLKGTCREAEIEAFERQIAPSAVAIVKTRDAWAGVFGEKIARFYANLGGVGERVEFFYKPDLAIREKGEYLAKLAAVRERDAVLQISTRGPHRDDFAVRIGGRDVRQFASEGQQRALVIAIRLAQVEWFHKESGIVPVILIDDILGELDQERTLRFWACLPGEMQVFATGTRDPGDPHGGDWKVITVDAGRFF